MAGYYAALRGPALAGMTECLSSINPEQIINQNWMPVFTGMTTPVLCIANSDTLH
jgi:hypothetical protein